MTNDGFREVLLQHIQQLNVSLTALYAPLQSELQNLHNKKDGDIQKLKESQKQIIAIEQDLIRQEDKINALKDDLTNDARDNLKEKIRELSYRTTEQIRNSYDDEFESVITDMLNGLQQVCDRVGTTLHSAINENLISEGLIQRIPRWSSPESNEFEANINSLSGYDIGKVIGVGSEAGGVLSLGLGATYAFSAYTTAATTSASTGFFSTAYAALAGGSAAPVVTTVTAAAAPFVAGGLVLVVAGHYIYKTMKDKKIQHNRVEVRKVIKTSLKDAEEKVCKQIRIYVNDQFDNYFSRLKSEMERKKRYQDSIINEKDIIVLQRQIDDKQGRLDRVHDYLEHLKTLTPAKLVTR